MEFPKGISIALFNAETNKQIRPDPNDGYLGTGNNLELVYYDEILEEDEEPDPEAKPRFADIMIQAVCVAGRNIHAFVVNEEKDILPLENLSGMSLPSSDPAAKLPQGAKLFRCYAPVTYSKKYNCLTTKFPGNNIRLVEPLGDGWYQMWRVAVISQNGRFFLTVEKNHEPFRCYRTITSVVCPAFTKVPSRRRKGWPPLVTHLNRVIIEREFDELPPIDDVEQDPPIKDPPAADPDLPENQARVYWFSDAEQYGMLVTRNRVARVHWSKIERPADRRRIHLKAGELVTFAHMKQAANEDSIRETEFNHEAVGVKLLK